MRLSFLSLFPALVVSVLAAVGSCATAAEPTLGDPPTAPSSVAGLPGAGVRIQGVTGGFSVDIASREEVRSFYNAVFTSSESVPMSSTADVGNCVAGTNSTAFREAVLRRINWYRAMAGVPASVTFDPVLNSRCQQAAVIMSRNNALSHFPTPGWLCFTGNGANAASNSNLALGYTGAQAITAYVNDLGANNEVVGHRRWILHPQTQVMGTGDVPAQQNLYPPANATWVFDANAFGPRPTTREPFVAWPPPGYVPHPTVYARWSLAVSNADLSSVTVSMTLNGAPVPVEVEPYETGAGENAIVWVPLGLNPDNSDTLFPFDGTDTTYDVTVSNIKSGPATFAISYSVTVFDPEVPGPGHVPPTITGPTEPGVGRDNFYTFVAVPGATGYEWRAALRELFHINDGAESGLGNFDLNTSGGYQVWITSPVASGNRAFNLQHPAPPVPQIMTLNTNFLVRTNTVLTFRSRLAWASTDEYARVQLSTNGADWHDVYAQPGDNGPGEGGFSTRTVPLAFVAGQVARLRFNYDFDFGVYYPPTEAGDGWVIDNIVLTNVESFEVVETEAVEATQFLFNPPESGLYSLHVRPLLYDEFPLEWGPSLDVQATTNLPPTIVMSQPQVFEGEIILDFAVTGGAGTFRLLESAGPGGTWTTNTSAVFSTNVPAASYRFTASIDANTRFYRVKTP